MWWHPLLDPFVQQNLKSVSNANGMLVSEKEEKWDDAVGFSVQDEEQRESNRKLLPPCADAYHFHLVERMCHQALCELQVPDLYRNVYPRVNYGI